MIHQNLVSFIVYRYRGSPVLAGLSSQLAKELVEGARKTLFVGHVVSVAW